MSAADEVSEIVQDRVVLALMSEGSLEAAARSSGVTSKTITRWFDTDLVFAGKVRAARASCLAQGSTRLVGAVTKAVDALVRIVDDKEAPPASVVTAARTILEGARAFVETDDLAERIRQLELRGES